MTLTTALESFLNSAAEDGSTEKRMRRTRAAAKAEQAMKKRPRGRPRKEKDEEGGRKKKQAVLKAGYDFEKPHQEASYKEVLVDALGEKKKTTDEDEAAAAPAKKVGRQKMRWTPEGGVQTMASFFQPRPLKVGPDGELMPRLVPRFGRIYKRKPPDRVKEKNCGQLKNAPGMRLCRMCKCLQPLEKFYKYGQRFVCKKHHYEMVQGRKQIRFKGCPYEKLAWRAWVELHALCPLLGYAHVNYDRHDMMDLMMKAKIPAFCDPRVVPIDPRQPLRPRNVAIVTEHDFQVLAYMLKQTLSAAQFILFVQACNLLPENADVAAPWDPFQDASYKRTEIDVIPILEQESTQLKQERPALDAVQYALEKAPMKRKRRSKDDRGQAKLSEWLSSS